MTSRIGLVKEERIVFTGDLHNDNQEGAGSVRSHSTVTAIVQMQIMVLTPTSVRSDCRDSTYE